MTGIGSCDLSLVLNELDEAKDYERAKKINDNDEEPQATEAAIKHIRGVAKRRLAQLLLARFLLLNLLVQEAGKLPGGLQQKEHRRLWVLLQAESMIFGQHFEGDVFTNLSRLLRGASAKDLEDLIFDQFLDLHPLLDEDRDPETGATPPFFCVLDQVQVTVAPQSGRLSKFMSGDGKTRRPNLREIWLSWSTASQR